MRVMEASPLLWLACAICLLAFAAASSDASSTGSASEAASASASSSGLAPTLVLMPEAAEKDGAVCLDGSPAGYYVQSGNSSNWLIFLGAGGWCASLPDCYSRTQTSLGSSTLFEPTMEWTGFLSFNESLNPEFASWSKVWIAYCDGSSFSGNASAPVEYNGSLMYFRGRRILTAAIQHLLTKQHMSIATQVILAGPSAGGIAVLNQIDYLRTLLPASMSLHGFTDASYFPDLPNRKLVHVFREYSGDVLVLHNATTDQTCQALYGSQDYRCFMAQYELPFVTTPMFLLASQYDTFQLQHIMLADMNATDWYGCIAADPHTCTNAIQLAAIQNYRNQYMKTLAPVLQNKRGTGVFLHSCFGHMQSFSDDDWSGIVVQGRSIRQAFGNWYFQRSNPVITVDLTWPKNPTCQTLTD